MNLESVMIELENEALSKELALLHAEKEPVFESHEETKIAVEFIYKQTGRTVRVRNCLEVDAYIVVSRGYHSEEYSSWSGFLTLREALNSIHLTAQEQERYDPLPWWDEEEMERLADLNDY